MSFNFIDPNELVQKFWRDAKDMLRNGRYEEAIEQLNQVLILDTNSDSAYYNRGLAKNFMGNISGAIADYSRAIDLNPKNAEALFNRGVIRLNGQDLVGALSDFNALIDYQLYRGEDLADIFIARAKVFIELNSWDDAESDLNAAINHNPGCAEIYLHKGIICDHLVDSVNAIRNYTICINLDAKIALAYYNRGYHKYKSALYEEALEDFNRGIEISNEQTPKYQMVLLMRGNIFQRKKKWQEAIKDYTNAIRLDSKDSKAYFNRAQVRFEVQDLPGAIADYTLCLSLDNENTFALYNRGMAKYDLSDYWGALDDFDRLISLESDDGEAYLFRGKVKIKLGNINEACRDFGKAGELGEATAYDLLKKHNK